MFLLCIISTFSLLHFGRTCRPNLGFFGHQLQVQHAPCVTSAGRPTQDLRNREFRSRSNSNREDNGIDPLRPSPWIDRGEGSLHRLGKTTRAGKEPHYRGDNTKDKRDPHQPCTEPNKETHKNTELKTKSGPAAKRRPVPVANQSPTPAED